MDPNQEPKHPKPHFKYPKDRLKIVRVRYLQDILYSSSPLFYTIFNVIFFLYLFFGPTIRLKRLSENFINQPLEIDRIDIIRSEPMFGGFNLFAEVAS